MERYFILYHFHIPEMYTTITRISTYRKRKILNTQSHAILTFFLVRKGLELRNKEIRAKNTILFSGALLPDLPLYIFFWWYTFFMPTPQLIIWRHLYFETGWQISFNIFHSLPLWSLAGIILWLTKKEGAALFCLAAFLASAQDFLVHHEDAHAHFYPY